MLRQKKLLIVSHCLLNQNSVVKPLARAAGAFPVIQHILNKGIGIIQLPCPEFKYLGPERQPMSKEQYDSSEYRKLCKDLFIPVLEDIKKYLKSGYDLIGILGINHSPTCSLSGSRGIFTEEIFKILEEENIDIKTFEIPTDYNEKSNSLKLFEELGI